MKVYVVTDGDFSDYSIQKVFLDETKAKLYRTANHFRNEIEEYEIADDTIEGDEKCLEKAGVVYEFYDLEKMRYDTYPAFKQQSYVEKKRVLFSAIDKFVVYVWLEENRADEERAKKIAYDLLAQYKYEHIDLLNESEKALLNCWCKNGKDN